MAYGKAQNDFGSFQKDCHVLAVELVKALKVYFQVPESQFSLYKINGANDFELVAPSLINALSLKSDSFYQFGIGLTVCAAPETLPEELILIHVLLRRDIEHNFFVRYENEPKEFEVNHKNRDSFSPFFDFLHDTIIKTYDEQLQVFIGQSTRRKLGYKM
jgi:hypothetical protein